MGRISDFFGKWSRPKAPPRPIVRAAAFPAADIGRLTASWTTDPGAINRWLRFELRTLRARSRQLARGDAYAAKFLHACVTNIAGPVPFKVTAKTKRPRLGGLDTDANATIETAWQRWGRKGECEVTGKLSLAALHRLIVKCLARDGEVLIRRYRGRQYGRYGVRLQILDIDRLDEQRNDENANGAVKMGVQVDRVGRPVAYHLLTRNPGELGLWNTPGTKEYEIVPAEDIDHLFIADWPEQVRGFPWMHAAMVRLWQLGGFEEAAVIHARVGASQMVMLEQNPDAGPPAPLSGIADEVPAHGDPQINVEPGATQALPYGWRVAQGWDPRFPDQAVEPFIRACLRGAAASFGMAYHSLANDPSNVNYSTARVALLEERDLWSSIQSWYIEHFCDGLYLDWLRMASTVGELPDYFLNRERYEAVSFQPKRWAWVDPKADTDAQIAALDAKLTSRTRIAAQNGEDIEEIFDELAAEADLAEDKDIDLAPAKPAAQSQPPAAPSEPDNEDDDEDDTEEARAAYPRRAAL